ncbi:MAG: diguanylate cyclase [Polyangiaceae bacterium]|jgi:two-component system, cell cycle response regulator
MAVRPPAFVRGSEIPVERRPHILVADDDTVTRDLLASILQGSGYDVTTCGDGQEAVERVGDGGIDLVLLDATMPRLSGLEACRVLKGMTADAFLPVLISTVKTDPGSRVEGLKIGADDYVCKPFEEGELLGRVRAMIRIKRLYDDMQDARAMLERVSVHDELTGLHNYRFLHDRLESEFKRAEKAHEPLACFVLDVDRLKSHNDRGGRPFGDAVLKGVAEVIRRSVREADVVARYGGDEFLVVLPATHFAGSLSVAERIWRDVAATDWGVVGTPTAGSHVTVSMGVALYPTRDVRTKDALLKAADLALLHAKREGSNRICVFQQQGFIYTPNTAAPDKGPTRRSRSPFPGGSRKRDV